MTPPGTHAEPTVRHDAARPERSARARADLRDGFAMWRLALALAMLDVRNRYRGSVLGPLWNTLSTAAMVGGLGLLYATLFRIEGGDYVRHLAVSLIVWQAIAAFLQDACVALTSAGGVMRQVAMPLTVHLLRCVLRAAITAAHALPIVPVVFLVTGRWPGAEALLAIPAILLLLASGMAAAMLLGVVCARFRDVPPIIANVTQLAFFMTPVLWPPSLLDPAVLPWMLLNPFHVMLELLRGPLVEGGASATAWLAAVAWTAVLAAAGFAVFRRFRARVPYWI
jgi:lipopolysaccharide transport system permease protein